jgi:hypothetical protein
MASPPAGGRPRVGKLLTTKVDSSGGPWRSTRDPAPPRDRTTRREQGRRTPSRHPTACRPGATVLSVLRPRLPVDRARSIEIEAPRGHSRPGRRPLRTERCASRPNQRPERHLDAAARPGHPGARDLSCPIRGGAATCDSVIVHSDRRRVSSVALLSRRVGDTPIRDCRSIAFEDPRASRDRTAHYIAQAMAHRLSLPFPSGHRSGGRAGTPRVIYGRRAAPDHRSAERWKGASYESDCA